MPIGDIHAWVARRHHLVLLIALIVLVIIGIAASYRPAQQQEKTELHIEPADGSFLINAEISAKVVLNAVSPINAAEATIHFSPDALEVTSILFDESLFSLWAQEPTSSNALGIISFKGGLPTPGFTGKGEIISVTFRSKRAGWTTLAFSNTSVLANDGRGTGVLEDVRGASFLIREPRSSRTDLDGDGSVTVSDLRTFLLRWGSKDAALDFNGDGNVDVKDLAMLLSSFSRRKP